MLRTPDTNYNTYTQYFMVHQFVRTFVGLAFLIFGFVALHGQTGKLYTAHTELSSSMITDIHQDRYGYVWIATEDGLNRFDGIKFTTFKQDGKNPFSVLNNIVRIIAEDTDGLMYVGYINGLQYYDPGTKEFYTVPFRLRDGNTVDAHVLSIFQRASGQLLVGTSGYGVFEVVWEGGKRYCRELSLSLPTDLIIHIYEDSNSRLWVSTEDSGLFAITGNTCRQYFGEKKVQNSIISSIIEDQSGTLWAGSLDDGLYRYEATTDTFIQVSSADGTDFPVSELIVSASNTVYVATDGRGVKFVDRLDGFLKDLELPIATVDYAKARMTSILEDRDGNIWIGLYQKGVFMMPAHKHRFGYIGYKSLRKNLIGSSAVMSIFEDSRGELWVGSDNDGLYRVSADLTSSRRYTTDPRGSGAIMAIYEDSKEQLWVGSYLDGLGRFDRSTGRLDHPVILKDEAGANVQRIFHLAEDEQQRLWVATMGSGLFRVDLNTWEVKHYAIEEKTKFKPYSDCLPNAWINCVLISDGRLFFGTYDGLGCLDMATESFISVFGKNRLLGDDVIYSIYEDGDGHLWLGTSKGLKRVELETLKITEYTVAEGLASNMVWSIESDPHGDLWLSTNKGITKMEVRRERFLNFHAGDGLQGDEFMRKVSLKSRDGRLFFGGLHGISYFYPEEIRLQLKKLNVQVVDLFIHNRAVKRGMKSGRFTIVDSLISQAKEFHFANYDNSFAIEFSTMDFVDSERIVFQYSMNGNEWISLPPSNNRITFENLAPGTHRLKVRAVAANAVSSVRDIALIVHPVWFLSPFAKFGYVMLAALMAYVAYIFVRNRRRVRHEMREHRRKEEINEAKLQLFVNIAHEIRTPLTLIAGPIKQLSHLDTQTETGHLYRIMDRNVNRMLDLVNQMLDVQKIGRGQLTLKVAIVDMVRYTREICALFDAEFLAKGIRFTMDLPDNPCYARIDPRNFDKVLVNVLSNACRFTPPDGWIKVELREQLQGHQGILQLTVADSGQPIDTQDIERIFDCFYQSETHRDQNSGGAGIGLYLAKQLMELHGGSIRAENMEEGGCRFIMSLPATVLKDDRSYVSQPNGNYQRKTLPILRVKIPVKLRDGSDVIRRVLLADDDLDILSYLSDTLSAHYAVSAFSDGESAYKFLLANPQDLVISDVMMPAMDGFSFCERIRQNPNLRHIPVILLTARAEESDNLAGLTAGADAYLTKPFNLAILLKTIESLIQNRELIRKSEREQVFQDNYIRPVTLKSADEKLLERVHMLIEKNLNNPLLSVEMLSAELGISRVHLHRKLKQLTNMTTRELVRSIRLKQAARLMEQKGLSVSEIAYAVGYSDLSNFSVSFKQMYGVSPSAYASQKTGK